MHIPRVMIVWLAMIFAVHPSLGQRNGTAAAEKPSIILISIDTLRADKLSCYSPRARKTPSLDKIAEGGTLFSAINSQVPLTLPSHVSMLTSTYPLENGVQDNGDHLAAGTTTLASTLKSQGYRTGAFLGGFVLDRRFGMYQGFDTYDSTFDTMHTKASDPGDVKRPGKEVAAAAKEWLKSGSKQPFFLFLHIYDLHTPYSLAQEEQQKYGTGYDGELAYVDEVIGDFWDFLGTQGFLKNSLVVLTSDHGESLGDHGETTHGFFIYQSTLHVPLLMHWPTTTKKMPDQIESPGGLVDLAPTILRATQLPVPKSFRGRDLLAKGEADVYSDNIYPEKHFAASPLASLRRGRYKLIEAPKPELFDLADDPTETKNLYSTKQPVASALHERLKAFRKTHSQGAKKQSNELSADAAEKLRALGYMTSLRRASDATRLPDPKDKIRDYEEYGRALGLGASGQLEEANRVLAELIQRNPDLTDVRVTRGLNLQQMGRHAEAVEVFRKVIEIDPAHAIAHFDIALSYYNLDRFEDAERELEAALAISPDYTKAESLLATIMVRQQRIEQAEARFNHILQVSPRDFEAHSNLGALAAMKGNWEEGIQHLRSALSIDPNSAEAHNTLGSIFLRQKEFVLAKGEFQNAIRLRPELAFAHYNLALAHTGLGDLKSARTEFESALAYDPKFTPAQSALDRLPPSN